MLAYFESSLGWRDLLEKTWQEFQADRGMGLAAQLAYYFFLALFPALLFLIALASFLPADDLVGRVAGMLRGVAPEEVIAIVTDQLKNIAAGRQGGLLSFGVIAALWSSSAAMVAIIDALNRAYDVEEGRPWWKQRLTAVLLTVGVATFMLVSFALVVAGPELADWVAGRVGLGGTFAWTWKIVQWPLVFALVATAIGLVYHFAPDVDQDFVWITPGSLLATALWLLGSLAFRLYVVNFGSYNETYGAIGGVMVLMLWLYLTGLCIILGAEMNAEIEHASPHCRAAGETVPGQRRTIGARAARRFREGAMQPLAAVAAKSLKTMEEEENEMAGYDQSLADLIRSTIHDAQDLVRGEIALAKAELKQEVRRAGAGAAALAAAAVTALIAAVFLLTALAWGLTAALGWPAWTGFAIVGGVALLAALVLAAMGRKRFNGGQRMPLTAETLRETMQWTRAR